MKMSKLQAVIDFQVELHKFVNIDLFQRGFYQIRILHDIVSKTPYKIEVSCPNFENEKNKNDKQTNIVFPPCIINGIAISKTFNILYKNEEVILNDVIKFKDYLIIDAENCLKSISNIEFSLDVELWFNESNFLTTEQDSMRLLFKRQLVLHFNVCRGLHYFLPVIFDYFHLSTITLSVHACLITICLPYLSKSEYTKKIDTDNNYTEFGYDYLLFDCTLSEIQEQINKNYKDLLKLRQRRAHLLHWQLCSLLFSSIQNLQRKFTEYLKQLPPWMQLKLIRDKSNIQFQLQNLSILAQKCYKCCLENSSKSCDYDFINHQNACFVKEFLNENFDNQHNNLGNDDLNNEKKKFFDLNQPEDYVTLVVSDLAYICGSLIVFWQVFIKLVTHNDKITQYLAKIHHLHRCKRFSEAFFIKEKTFEQIYSHSEQDAQFFYTMSEHLRKSDYLQMLPKCQIECLALDGNHITLPIIFEEKFDIVKEIENLSNDTDSKLIKLEEANNDLSNNETSFMHSSLSDISTNSSLSSNCSSNDQTQLDKNSDKLILNYSSEKFSTFVDQQDANLILNNEKSLNEKSLNCSSNICSQNLINELKNSSKLLGFRHYNNVRGEVDEAKILLDNGCTSIYSIVETVSLNNIKFLNEKDKTNRLMISSESLPDLSIESLGKSIKQISKEKKILKKIKINKNRAKSANLDLKFKYSKENKKNNLNLLESFSFNNFMLELDFLKNSNLIIENFYENNLNDLDVVNFIEDNNEKIDTSIYKNNFINHECENSSIYGDNHSFIKQDKCTILDMFKQNTCLLCGKQKCDCNQDLEISSGFKRLSMITNELVSFVKAKERFRDEMCLKNKGWYIYSDFSSLASRIPYFQCDNEFKSFTNEGTHLVICVHGLDGNCADLRLVKTYLELGLPATNFEFLMSQSNQGETFDSFEIMTNRLCQEILTFIEVNSIEPTKISFIGHSLGNIIIRAVLSKAEISFLLPKLHCFLSLSGPHLGNLYNDNGIVNMGLWFMQKWKKSTSLLQLTMKDNSDLHKTFLYKLSKESKMHYFKYILLCGSSQDHYVPRHSAHIYLCSQAAQDNSTLGKVYREMVTNLLKPIVERNLTKITKNETLEEKFSANTCLNDLNKNVLQTKNCSLMRFDVWHSSAGGANALIGRAAHIAVLDSELFIEKFMAVVGLKYFA